MDSEFNKSSFGDGTLRDIKGACAKWLLISSDRAPWSVKEEGTTKQQVLEKANLIENLHKKLEKEKITREGD